MNPARASEIGQENLKCAHLVQGGPKGNSPGTRGPEFSSPRTWGPKGLSTWDKGTMESSVVCTVDLRNSLVLSWRKKPPDTTIIQHICTYIVLFFIVLKVLVNMTHLYLSQINVQCLQVIYNIITVNNYKKSKIS